MTGASKRDQMDKNSAKTQDAAKRRKESTKGALSGYGKRPQTGLKRKGGE